MLRTRLWLAPALALTLALGLYLRAEDKDKHDNGPEVGKPAPTFDLHGSDDKDHKLADYLGKIVVVHFQSTTCPWERAYQPYLNQTAAKFAKTEHDGKTVEVVFLGINANKSESMDNVKAKLKEEDVPYVVTKDPGNKIADAYHATTTPHIFIIDARGVLRYKGGVEKAPTGPGGATKSEEQYLQPVLEALVAGKEPPVTQTKSIGCAIKRENK